MTDFATTYGLALYALVQEEDLTVPILKQLKEVCAIFAQNPAIYKVLSVPDIAKEDRVTVVSDVLGTQVHPYVVNFLKVLVENGGILYLNECLEVYVKQYNKDNNIETITAITSVPLSGTLFEKLKAKLESITGKTVELTNTVDPACIGGIVLEFDTKQLDGSIQSKLNNLREQMLAVMA